MSAKVWIDGTLFDKNDAKVSVFDHGLLFGDGVWAGTRIYGGTPFRLGGYLDQLYESADGIALPMPLPRDEMAKAVETTIRANNRTEGYVRVTVTRGVGTLGLDPRKCTSSVIVIAEDVVPYPREVYDAGLDVVTVQGQTPTPPGTLSQVDIVAAKARALQAGCFEAILLDTNGSIVRTSDGELFLIHEGVLTHSAAFGMADRVIWAFVRELADRSGVRASELNLTRDDILAAVEVFIASAAAGIIGVRAVDGKPVGAGAEGPVTRRLREGFARAVRAGG